MYSSPKEKDSKAIIKQAVLTLIEEEREKNKKLEDNSQSYKPSSGSSAPINEMWISEEERRRKTHKTPFSCILETSIYSLIFSSVVIWGILLSFYIYGCILLGMSTFMSYKETMAIVVVFSIIALCIFLIRKIAEKRQIKEAEATQYFKRHFVHGFILLLCWVFVCMGMHSFLHGYYSSLFIDWLFYGPFFFIPLAFVFSSLEYIFYKNRYISPEAIKTKILEIFLLGLLTAFISGLLISIVSEVGAQKILYHLG